MCIGREGDEERKEPAREWDLKGGVDGRDILEKYDIGTGEES
jgi:hypothetical protein